MRKVLVQLYFNKKHTVWCGGKSWWGIKLQESPSVWTFRITFSCFYQRIQISISRPFCLLHPLTGLTHSHELINNSNDLFLLVKEGAFYNQKQLFSLPLPWNSLSISSIPSLAQPDSPSSLEFQDPQLKAWRGAVSSSTVHPAECIKPHISLARSPQVHLLLAATSNLLCALYQLLTGSSWLLHWKSSFHRKQNEANLSKGALAKMVRGMNCLSYENKLKEGFSAWRKKLLGKTYSSLSVVEGGL